MDAVEKKTFDTEYITELSQCAIRKIDFRNEPDCTVEEAFDSFFHGNPDNSSLDVIPTSVLQENEYDGFEENVFEVFRNEFSRAKSRETEEKQTDSLKTPKIVLTLDNWNSAHVLYGDCPRPIVYRIERLIRRYAKGYSACSYIPHRTMFSFHTDFIEDTDFVEKITTFCSLEIRDEKH